VTATSKEGRRWTGLLPIVGAVVSTAADRISIAFNLMFTHFAETMAVPRWKATAGTSPDKAEQPDGP
jgi:hypothetical protein